MANDLAGMVGLGVVAGYNVVQNELLPDWAYVPANLTVVAGLVRYARRQGITYDQMGLGVNGLRRGVRAGSVLALGITVGTAAMSRSPLRRVFHDERAMGHTRGEAAFRSVVRFPVGTAFFEEVAFRGVLDALWRKRTPQSARVATSLAFGAWHLLPTYRDYPGMAPGRGSATSVTERMAASVGGALVTAAAGYLLAVLRQRYGGLAAPWLAHAAHNTSAYLVARHTWRYSTNQLRVARTRVSFGA